MLQGEETKELLTVEWQGIAQKVQQVRMLMDKMPEKRLQIAISAISKMQTAMTVAVRAIRGEAQIKRWGETLTEIVSILTEHP